MKTIKSKILTIVISTLIVITVLVTLIAVNITHEIMHKDADRILKNTSQKEAAYINEMLNDFLDSANIITHYAVSEVKNPHLLENYDYAKNYIDNVRFLYDEVAHNTSGVYSYYFCLSPGFSSTPMGFYSQFEDDGDMYELTEEEFSKLSIITDNELEEYSRAADSSAGQWVEPHPSRFTGVSVISYITPIYSNGIFIGLLGFNMEFDHLIDRINGIEVYENGEALLISEAHDTVYSADGYTEYEGEFTEAEAELVNGMCLELRVAYKDIQSNIRYLLTNIILAFIGVLILAIIFTYYMTDRITGPLNKLIAVISDATIGENRLNELDVDSDDEIGLLAKVLKDAASKSREYTEYISSVAYRDSLTGVKNSTAYAEAIEEIDKDISLGEADFGVIVADVNFLKETNDIYGHYAGNDLLIRAANLIESGFKVSPVFRIGGDEFVVILKGEELKNHLSFVNHVDNIFSTAYIEVNNDRIGVSVARGISLFDKDKDISYADVFHRADKAMYENKMEIKVQKAYNDEKESNQEE